jgi:hypothetical protein
LNGACGCVASVVIVVLVEMSGELVSICPSYARFPV